MDRSKMTDIYVVVPMYNSAAYILSLFESLEAQSIANELCVVAVDDGSSDETLARAEQYVPKSYSMVVLKKEHSGLSDTRNYAIDWILASISSEDVQRSYVMYLDSDDGLEPNALEALKSCSIENDADVVFFSASLRYETEEAKRLFGERYDHYYERNERYVGSYSGPNYLLSTVRAGDFKSSAAMQFTRLSHIANNKLRFLSGILHEDNLYTLTSTCLAHRVAYLDKELYVRSIHADSIMTKPASWKNAFGYFKSALAAWSLLSGGSVTLSSEQLEAYETLVDGWLEAATDYCCALGDEEVNELLGSLSNCERAVFSSTVQNRVRARDERVQSVAKTRDEAFSQAEQSIRSQFECSTSWRVGRVVTALPRRLFHRR